jgi:hypothetical protein
MKPSRLVPFLVRAIEAGKNVLITGEPGTGKSDMANEARTVAGAEFILTHPSVSDSTEAKGLPAFGAVKKGAPITEATFLPFGDLARALRATTRTVWMLDDLGQATPSVQASFMQLLLARQVIRHVLPDCVSFIAATNYRKAGMGVSGMLDPIKSRFVSIVKADADVGDWVAWAQRHNINPMVTGYVRFDGEALLPSAAAAGAVPAADMQNSPSPRTWANVSELLSWGLSEADEREAIAGAIGPEYGRQFSEFKAQWGHIAPADGILADPHSFDIRKARPEVLHITCVTLALRTTPANFANVCAFAVRLEAEGRGEFASFLIRDTTRRAPELKATPAYQAIETSPVGAIIHGDLI